jgi:hypothetical protein
MRLPEDAAIREPNQRWASVCEALGTEAEGQHLLAERDGPTVEFRAESDVETENRVQKQFKERRIAPINSWTKSDVVQCQFTSSRSRGCFTRHVTKSSGSRRGADGSKGEARMLIPCF